MKRLTLLTIATLMLLACSDRQQPVADGGDNRPFSEAMQMDTTFVLNNLASLHLYSDGDIAAIELTYGDEVQEFAGSANTMFVRDDEGLIHLDTVHLDGGLSPQYIVRTADRSSTYGAEVWYVVYPLMPKLEEEGVGPWALAKVPWDLPGLVDIDGDGDKYLVYYEYGHTGRYSVYAFEAGIFSEIPSLRTLK